MEDIGFWIAVVVGLLVFNIQGIERAFGRFGLFFFFPGLQGHAEGYENDLFDDILCNRNRRPFDVQSDTVVVD